MATVARAQDPEYLKRTDLTFSGPVHLPTVSLPAGTYRFELANPDTDRRVVRVSSVDGKKIYGLFLSVPDQRINKPDNGEPLVLFSESPADAPQAVRAWFYPSESTGYEFVYPKDEALAIARTTHQRVRSMEKGSDDNKALRGAKIGFVDEHGEVTEGATATSGRDEPNTTDKDESKKK